MINIIIGIFLVAAATFYAALLGGDVFALIDLNSMIIVLGLTLIGTISSSIGSRTQIIFRNFGNFSIMAGWVGLLIGLILILNNINLSDLEKLGSALAVAILPPFYGYILKFCSMICEFYFEKESG